MSDQNPSIDEDTLTANKHLSGNRRINLSRRKALIIGLVVVVIAGFGAIIYNRIYKNEVKPVATRPYSFDQNKGDTLLFQHVLEGTKDGDNFEFEVPAADFLYADGRLDQTDSRFPKTFNEKIIDKGRRVELGQRVVSGTTGNVYLQSIVAARIVPPEEQSSFNSLEYFGERISSLVFVNGSNATHVALGLQAPKAFTNEAIKGNANIYEFNAISTKALYEEQPIKQIRGYLVDIKGKNASYYLMIGAVEDVWKASPKSWQKILNSLKVDQ